MSMFLDDLSPSQRRDLLSGARVLSAPPRSEAPLAAAVIGGTAEFSHADNMDATVLELVRPVLAGEEVTIVVGFESLLSVLAMVIALRPGLSHAERGTVRILLGEQDRPPGRTPYPASMTPSRLVAHVLRAHGVAMTDPRDIMAVECRDALRRESIQVRVFDAPRAPELGIGVQANLIVSEDFAVLSSAGFSRRDILERAVMADRVANDTDAYGPRRAVAHRLWRSGRPCTRQVRELLDGVFAPRAVSETRRHAARAAMEFPLFAPPRAMGTLQADLVGQALARVYENGFAFVRVPAGAGQADLEREIARRLAFNAERLTGMQAHPDGRAPWRAHIETVTGARVGATRVAGILAAEAPLLPDGSIAPRDAHEDPLEAVYRRLRCRPRRARDGAGTDFAGYPAIEVLEVDAALSKAQRTALEALDTALEAARAAALEAESAVALSTLAQRARESGEAAALSWRNRLAQSVRTGARPAPAGTIDQSFLPIFGGEDVPSDLPDPIEEALASRAWKGIDRVRAKRLVDLAASGGPARPCLVVIEDPLARHMLARRLAEMVEEPVLAIVPEAALRRESVSGREVTYQRAESPAIATSMLTASDPGPAFVLAGTTEAAEITLPAADTAVVMSAPEDPERIAAALASIDGLDKTGDRIRICAFAEGLPDSQATPPDAALLHPVAALHDAAAVMRNPQTDMRDGVADILAAIMDEETAPVSEPSTPDPHGRIAMSILDTAVCFTLCAVSGTSGAPDSAAAPPRLLAVWRDPESGEEQILRNQVGVATLLERLQDASATAAPPGAHVLETIGRHLSHLTHWDARPERMVAPLEALAQFLGGPGETGERMFSDLTLTSMEILHARWCAHLERARDLAAPEAPGLSGAIAALEELPVWEIEEIRADLEACRDFRTATDMRRSRALHDRVVAVIHGTGAQAPAS